MKLAEKVIKKFKEGSSNNRFYKVIKDHKVESKGKLKSTNSYYGSSQIYSNARDEIVAKKGDEIHELVGGRFLIRDDKVIAELHTRQTSDPFSYNPELPLDMKYLKEISSVQASDPKGGYRA